MRKNLLQESSRLHRQSCIHHCSPFISIAHNYHSLLHRHSSFIQHSFHTMHPPRSWPSSQSHTSHIRSYYSLHQPVLHSLSMCPNHLNTLCSAQPGNYLVIPVLLRISSFLTQSICFTSHRCLRHLISITFSLSFYLDIFIHC